MALVRVGEEGILIRALVYIDLFQIYAHKHNTTGRRE